MPHESKFELCVRVLQWTYRDFDGGSHAPVVGRVVLIMHVDFHARPPLYVAQKGQADSRVRSNSEASSCAVPAAKNVASESDVEGATL